MLQRDNGLKQTDKLVHKWLTKSRVNILPWLLHGYYGTAVLFKDELWIHAYDIKLFKDQIWFKLDNVKNFLFGAIYIPPRDSPYFHMTHLHIFMKWHWILTSVLL